MNNINDEYSTEFDILETELGVVDEEKANNFANEMTISEMITNDNIDFKEIINYQENK